MDLLTWVVVPPATDILWPPDHHLDIVRVVQPHQLFDQISCLNVTFGTISNYSNSYFY